MVLQAVEKRPSAVYSGPFTISRACQELLLIRRNGTPHPRPCQSTGQACCSVHSSTPLADLQTRRRGKKSLLIRRDATLRIACLTGR